MEVGGRLWASYNIAFPLQAFHGGSAKVLHWCCSQESHKKSGIHYHMSLKLDRNQWWLRAKKFLTENYGISVHFSSVHESMVVCYERGSLVSRKWSTSWSKQHRRTVDNESAWSKQWSENETKSRKAICRAGYSDFRAGKWRNPRRRRVKETREKAKAFEFIRSFRNYFWAKVFEIGRNF